MHQKGYKLYDPVTKSIHYSRHVIFHEDVFPYASDFLNIFPSSPTFLTSEYSQNDFTSPLDYVSPETSTSCDTTITIPHQDSSPITDLPDDLPHSDNV